MLNNFVRAKMFLLLVLALPLYHFTTLSLSADYNITTFAGNGTFGYSGDGGPATSAQLNLPEGMAIDGAGDIYIADCVNNRVRKVNASGIISTFAGTSVGGYSGDNGPATSAQLNCPTGVAVDGMGNVYIADCSNNRIRKVNASGIISTFAGTGVGGYSGDNGTAALAQLDYPMGVAVDGMGNVYIADYNNNRIRKVNVSGIISTFAGTGTGGYSGDGGTAVLAQLNWPIGMTVDGAGNVYIADYGNSRMRKVNASGIISTFAGTGVDGHSGDNGLATSAQLDRPTSVAVDKSSDIYIADYSSNQIRKVNASGIISTFAGTSVDGYSGDNGPATLAQLCKPYSVVIGRLGDVYIADSGNHRVRVVRYSGQITDGGGGGGGDALANAYCYPVPARLSQGDMINFNQFTPNATIKIFSTAGRLVKELKADNSGALPPWDGRTDDGNRVGSGVYMVHARDNIGNKKIFKIMVVK